jgi:hypothetical protein
MAACAKTGSKSTARPVARAIVAIRQRLALVGSNAVSIVVFALVGGFRVIDQGLSTTMARKSFTLV